MLDNKHNYDVSIIIVNYNTSKLINDCIESIIKLTNGVTYEIIVVDNNTEDLSEVIKEASNPIVRLIQLPENVGFGRANNEGFKMSQGRNLFCLNPDTLLLNNAVKILSDYLDTHPECGACGGNLYDENLKPSLSFRRILPGIFWEVNELLNIIPEKLLWNKNRIYNTSNRAINVGYVTGADLMIKSVLFESLNGFSTAFFMYYEETDLCKRIKNLNFKIKSIPQAKIQHLEGKSFDNSDSINHKRLERSEHGRSVYMHRNHNYIYRKISNSVYYLFLWSRFVIKKSASYQVRLNLLRKMQ